MPKNKIAESIGRMIVSSFPDSMFTWVQNILYGTNLSIFSRPPGVERILMGNKICGSILSNVSTSLNQSEILPWRHTSG
jgi:hypothetical protein